MLPYHYQKIIWIIVMIARTTISINEHTNIPIECFYTYAVPTFDFRVIAVDYFTCLSIAQTFIIYVYH